MPYASLENRRAAYRRYHANHPERARKSVRAAWYKSQYGLSLEEYDKMLEDQDYGCAICGKESWTQRNLLSVDHDHKTGEVRGLLCSNCNNMLGHAHDDPLILYFGIRYLEKTL